MNKTLTTTSELPADLWKKDASLRRAGELINQADGRIHTVSFDFFDTLVWRLVHQPTDVFLEVGHRLHAEKLLRPEISPADFEVLRRVGEMKARERHALKNCEDVTLVQIYDQLKTVIADPAAASRIEVTTECELCLLNPVTIQFAQHAKSLGLNAVIISDIY